MIHVNKGNPLFGSHDEFGDCCMGAVMYGLDRCTCWEPVIEPVPTREVQEGPANLRQKCCHDCAYRADSPERAKGQHERLEDVASDRHGVFVCHQGGMPKVLRYVHPDGRVIEMDEDDYSPIHHGGRAWLADGRPADLCAGWGALGARGR